MYLFIHSDSLNYVEALRILDKYYENNDDPNIPDDVMSSLEDYGLAYDCQGFPGVFDYAMAAVRGTMAAVDCLVNRQCQVKLISWLDYWVIFFQKMFSIWAFFNEMFSWRHFG